MRIKVKEETFKQLLWFTGGAICGLAMLSISKASVPNNIPSHVTDDTAIYQNLSEIRVTKDHVPSFDSDISHLSQIEDRYQDRLPVHGRQIAPARSGLNSAMNRVSRGQYHYRGNSGSASAWNEKIPAPSP